MNKPITSNKFATDTWKMVQMLIDEAVLAEREACAKIIGSKAYSHIPKKNQLWLLLIEVANDIRARGQE